MNRRTALKFLFLTLVHTLLCKLKNAGLFARPWNAELQEHLLRTQSESAILKFCQEYPKLKSCKSHLAMVSTSSYSDMQNNRTYEWINRSISFVESVLSELPINAENFEARKGAFQILDYPLSADATGRFASKDFKEAWHNALKKNYAKCPEKIIKAVQSFDRNDAVSVWKLYNCGFVVKASNGCVGIDIRPHYSMEFTQSELDGFSKILDVLIITHAHYDHFDISLIEAMLKAGKEVYAPNQSALIEASKKYAKKFKLKRCVKIEDGMYPNFKSLYELGGVKSTKISNVEIVSYGGVQHKVSPETLNSVYVVKIGGITILHTGDNQDRGDNKMNAIYDTIASTEKVDVCFANVWANMNEIVKRSNPRIVIAMHENELHHPPLGRVPYRWTWQTENILKKQMAKLPQFIQMANGEEFIFMK